MILMLFLRSHLFKRSFSYSCPENCNIFSTTYKVNLFTFLCTAIISSRVISVYYDLKQDLDNIEKKLDTLQKK